MNSRRVVILVIWLILHLGGYQFMWTIQKRKQHWMEMKTELSSLEVWKVMTSDMMYNYWYLLSIMVTLICWACWRSGTRRDKRSPPE